jgi:hypothetical protein
LVLVCAPPLLLMVTPGETWVLDDVAPDVVVVSVGGAPVADDIDPSFDVEPTLFVALGEVDPDADAAAGPVADASDVALPAVESAELDEDDSDDVPLVSAAPTP